MTQVQECYKCKCRDFIFLNIFDKETNSIIFEFRVGYSDISSLILDTNNTPLKVDRICQTCLNNVEYTKMFKCEMCRRFHKTKNDYDISYLYNKGTALCILDSTYEDYNGECNVSYIIKNKKPLKIVYKPTYYKVDTSITKGICGDVCPKCIADIAGSTTKENDRIEQYVQCDNCDTKFLDMQGPSYSYSIIAIDCSSTVEFYGDERRIMAGYGSRFDNDYIKIIDPEFKLKQGSIICDKCIVAFEKEKMILIIIYD